MRSRNIAAGNRRLAFKSATIAPDRLLPGIHGLRGIAALAVVLFHLVHLAKISVPEPFDFIASDFGNGVHLFFVLSAFSLMHSTEHTMHRRTWATEYFIKRFFRISPLFYCIMTGMLLWPAISSQTFAVDLRTVLLNLTFTFGFAPWSGIVWAGWTVGVEMMFYVILPILMLTVRTTSATLVLVAISILFTPALRSTLDVHYENTVPIYGFNWAYFSFAANLCFFAMGLYAFRLTQEVDKASLVMRCGVPLASIAILGTLMLTSLDDALKGASRWDLILWGLGFTSLCIWQSTRSSRWCANWAFAHVGERSYSIYLLHPVVIVLFKNPIQVTYNLLTPHLGAYAFFACAGLVLVPLLLLAEITYRLIEIPGIQVGQRINARTRENAGRSQIACAEMRP